VKTNRHHTAGARRRLIAFLLGSALSAAAPRAQAVDWHATLSGVAGHDDDVLANPGDSQDLPSIESGYFQLAPEFALESYGDAWSFRGAVLYTHNRYSAEEAGSWNRVLGRAGAARRLAPNMDLGLDLSADRLRRTAFDDLDVDRLSASPRIVYRPGPGISIAVTGGLSRDHYPARAVPDSLRTGSDDLQTDSPKEFGVNLGLYRWTRFSVSGGASRIATSSTQLTSEYDGYRFDLSADARPGLGLELEAGFGYESRDYGFTRRGPNGHRVFRVTYRADHSREYSISAARDLGPRLRVRLDASRLNYDSDAESQSFDQTRIQAGLSFRFGAKPATTVSFPKLPEMAPRVRETGDLRTVTFRCRRPGAGSVVVTGSFNGWSTTGYVMADPDGNDVWEATVELPPGLYRYMFLVDNIEWLKPEGAAAYEDDGFGNENGILNVP